MTRPRRQLVVDLDDDPILAPQDRYRGFAGFLRLFLLLGGPHTLVHLPRVRKLAPRPQLAAVKLIGDPLPESDPLSETANTAKTASQIDVGGGQNAVAAMLGRTGPVP